MGQLLVLHADGLLLRIPQGLFGLQSFAQGIASLLQRRDAGGVELRQMLLDAYMAQPSFQRFDQRLGQRGSAALAEPALRHRQRLRHVLEPLQLRHQRVQPLAHPGQAALAAFQAEGQFLLRSQAGEHAVGAAAKALLHQALRRAAQLGLAGDLSHAAVERQQIGPCHRVLADQLAEQAQRRHRHTPRVVHGLGTLHDLGRAAGEVAPEQAHGILLEVRFDDQRKAVAAHIAFDGRLPAAAGLRLDQGGQHARAARREFRFQEAQALLHIAGCR